MIKSLRCVLFGQFGYDGKKTQAMKDESVIHITRHQIADVC